VLVPGSAASVAKNSQKGHPNHRTDATRYEGNLLGLCAKAFALRHCIWAQSKSDVRRLHHLLYHAHQIFAECVQVCFVTQLGREGFQGLSSIVLAAVEAPVYERLYTPP
jgi:hypothetical protein